jgi:ABC-type phosphate/phosphonate transport system substrate-binding protein
MPRSLCALTGLFLCLCTALIGPARQASAGGDTSVRIGMVQTFFHDVPKGLIGFATEPFNKVMRDTTGLNGALVIGTDPFSVARDLSANKIQLGVFHGHEVAWVQQKHPELKAFMIAVHAQYPVSAYVLVPATSPVTSFASLRGKDIAIPRRTKEHCRVFIERQCQGGGTCASKDYFGHIVGSSNVETALDDLCAGKFDAAIIDSIGLDFYKELQPGRFNKLRVLAHSEPFPPAVIAYRQGGLSEATLAKIRDGLCSAHKTPIGEEMMKMWKITSFEPVPTTYTQALADCLKAYPMPETK